jgi:3-deoxy-D-manno-octulosonic-acid transferase
VHDRHPDYRLIVTTVTETGREAVEQRLAGVAEHRYVPLDFPWVVSNVVDTLVPALFICVETELWPNLLRILADRRVSVVLVNGRLSSQSTVGTGSSVRS